MVTQKKAEKIAEDFSRELEGLCKKYGCDVGVWLTWRDLLHNFDLARKNPDIEELYFGLQIRFEDGKSKTQKGNKGAAKHSGDK